MYASPFFNAMIPMLSMYLINIQTVESLSSNETNLFEFESTSYHLGLEYIITTYYIPIFFFLIPIFFSSPPTPPLSFNYDNLDKIYWNLDIIVN